MYEDKLRDTYIRIFSVKDALEHGKKEGCCQCLHQIKGPKDHGINNAKFGPLDKTIYYCTDKGRLLQYDLEE